MTTLDLAARRRRIAFRAWHRGMRELDLLLGRFCDAELAGLPEADVADLERLLEAPDRDVLAWLTGEAPAPEAHDTPVLGKLRGFHTHAAPLYR